MTSLQDIARIVLIGIGATALMDLWLASIRRLGVPSLPFALVGRWAGHAARGRFTHPAIARAAPIAGEAAWGWALHYAVGVAFAGVLVASQGIDWTRAPSWPPALATGLATVVFPLFVMQPAMGAGFASSRTAAPLKSCARSVANHAVFGLGLYAAASALAWLLPF
jgi:Protein of unknown function (DUF2938)